MRMHTFLLLPALWCAAAHAQAPATPQPLVAASPPAQAIEQRIERIRIEDDGSVVEEVRYGGQAQSINVSPKAPVPDYEIVPADSARSRGLSRDALSGAPGQRVWNVFRF
ncbi:MAG: hypothetical protein EOO28_28625 [Comamonadaceae bacterium]|nr:MAG: hypothetical protein EOO28_28625 [Comamonadaceae bacterium]